MKPITKIIYNGNGSIIDLSLKGKELLELVDKELDSKRFSRIVSSPVQLYVTFFINPDEKKLDKTYQQNGIVYVKVSESLAGDKDIYSLQLAFSRLKAPEGINKVLIYIGEKEYKENDNRIDREGDTENNMDGIKYIAVEPKWSMEEVILPDEVKKKIIRATKIIENRDVIFDTLGYSRVDKTLKSIICFYGPAGTGKTITAQAIAKLLNKKIVISSYAQIESKYVGDGAKNLRKIFKDTEDQSAVLFMDECDSFLSKRIESTDSGSDKHYNRMSNELFQLLEDYTGCVIFATNLLTDIDKAFKSRIVDSIYFPLPDHEGKKKMLKKMCIPEILDKVFPSDAEFDSFVTSLEGFSGRDLRKSLLLSYAEVSDEIKSIGNSCFKWDIDKFRVGFDDVLNSFSEDTNSGTIPLDELQKFVEKKKLYRKQFELAKHAVTVDEGIDDREFLVLQELSKQLLNEDLDNRDIVPEMSLEEICTGVEDLSQKRLMIDIAIRVISIDGDFSENEKTFVRKVCSILGFTDQESESFVDYGIAMANAYSHWIIAIEKR